MKFNEQYIREYLTHSDVLALGVNYYLENYPELTREQAEEKALDHTIKQCRNRYRRDRLDGEVAHRAAFLQFEEDVHDGWDFCPKDRREEVSGKREQKKKEMLKRRQWENEAIRLEKLHERCERKGLDFEWENSYQIMNGRLRKSINRILRVVLAIPVAACMPLIVLFALFASLFPDVQISNIPEGVAKTLLIAFVIVVHCGLLGLLVMRDERNWLPPEILGDEEDDDDDKRDAKTDEE